MEKESRDEGRASRVGQPEAKPTERDCMINLELMNSGKALKNNPMKLPR
jgi:hypothetical protein